MYGRLYAVIVVERFVAFSMYCSLQLTVLRYFYVPLFSN